MNDRQILEKLETLDGSRGGNAARKAAVRIEDLAPLLQIPAKMKSTKAAGTTPTKAEFDALVDDVHNVFNRLREIHDVIQKRVL